MPNDITIIQDFIEHAVQLMESDYEFDREGAEDAFRATLRVKAELDCEKQHNAILRENNKEYRKRIETFIESSREEIANSTRAWNTARELIDTLTVSCIDPVHGEFSRKILEKFNGA